jgi:hypothetical protein
MDEFINHVARDDTLRGMNEVDLLTNLEIVLLNDRTYELIDGTRADGGLNNNGCVLGTYLQHFLNGCYYIAGIYLL